MTASLLNEYITKRLSAIDLETELVRLVAAYNQKKKTYLLVYASDMEKATMGPGVGLSLTMGDFHVLHEMLRNVSSKSIDIYLETPGGSGEAAEEIVEFLHTKFGNVDFVIAGEAKSAGTLMAMSADDIYMTESGSLGPIDAQVKIGRSVISAFDYVQWIEQKRKEAAQSGQLNPVDATMIAQITPGEFEGVFHAQQFAVDKLKQWLPKYKFKNWTSTETRKLPVTSGMKEERAESVASKLMDHSSWRSHGRSLKIKDLEAIGLRIKKIEDDSGLCDIVYRIKAVIRLLFGSSTHYKMFVTQDEKLFRDAMQAKPSGVQQIRTPVAELSIQCPQCGTQNALYVKFGPIPDALEKDLAKKAAKFPRDNKVTCTCGFQIDTSALRNQIESQVGKKIVD
jgi:hypothetical protein